MPLNLVRILCPTVKLGLTDEQRSELDTIESGVPDLERQIRAVMVGLEEEERAAETKETVSPDAEMRERIELRGRASVGRYLTAALRGRAPDGAEAELQQAAGVDGIPYELWQPRQEQRDEQRAITAAPSTVGLNLDVLRPYVFAPSVVDKLMVEMPMVESGTYASGTISTAATAGAVPKGGTGTTGDVPETHHAGRTRAGALHPQCPRRRGFREKGTPPMRNPVAFIATLALMSVFGWHAVAGERCPSPDTEDATLEYRPPSSGAKIRDAAGNGALAFTGSDAVAVSVTPDTTAPMVTGAAVDGARLTLTFDEPLDEASVPAAPGGFTVTVTRDGNAVPGHTVTRQPSMVSPPSNPIQAMGSPDASHASSSGLSDSGG